MNSNVKHGKQRIENSPNPGLEMQWTGGDQIFPEEIHMGV